MKFKHQNTLRTRDSSIVSLKINENLLSNNYTSLFITNNFTASGTSTDRPLSIYHPKYSDIYFSKSIDLYAYKLENNRQKRCDQSMNPCQVPVPSVTPCDPDQIGEFMSNMVSVSYTGYGPDIDGNFKDFSVGYWFYDYSEGWPPLNPRGIILSCGGEFNEIPPDPDLTVVLKVQVFLTVFPNSNDLLLGYLYLEDLNDPYYNSSYTIPVQSVTGGNTGVVSMTVGPLPSPSPSVEPSPSASVEPTPSPS